MSAEQIAAGLNVLEREWLTAWQGVKGAAFNAVAGDLRHKGLLISATNWNLNELGQQVAAILKEME